MKLKVIGIIAILLVVVGASCQSDDQIEFKRYYSGGSLVYQQHCQNCHGDKGQGLSALIPPLTDSIYLKNNKRKLACFIKNGLKGKITVAGRSFDDQMQPDDIAPLEIAKVLTYVTNSFGNKMRTVTLQQVQDDLKNCQ
ncbi:mono/diheme cytochrome c family protein [Mucilaginibacter sp. SG538B]|uniref:c-type cytochrome n=1 Tax=Mucilaginibacter TaxID=423349 RepID=UPI000871712D|nr:MULTISPECIES: c-type cytochrome [unclassified Mucilaginibacter]NVM65121.1 mono/diheme cytochrome c family protein [Mucilaginibacter sp. SG538B]SCW50154.1 Cytochrome C oxidase, cbb3-type, subunit III [Mucilaginibacter sp. NFR10]